MGVFKELFVGSGSGGSGGGNVTGPVSSTVNDIVLFNATDGTVIKDSGVQISTDGTFAANSDSLVPTQKAVKTYVTAHSSGGLSYNTVTSNTSLVANNGYIANSASLITFTLPTTSSVGDIFQIIYQGTGGWKVAQNASQSIRIGANITTSGTGGSLASSAAGDIITILCITANTGFIVVNSMGNITYV